ncbi:MAG: GatB/YqeY domain-containing protein, partial [Candidatus Woesearchaeota archaeon]
EVKEAAEKLGMLLRSLQATKGQSVKRGLGTIRQDVNVSVKGGNRVEIKGAQDLKMMTTLVEFEAHRQLQLITLQKNEYVKKVAFSNIIDVTEILKNTACPFVKKTIDNGGIVLGMSVKSFEGIFGIEVCPGRRVGSEISDYAKQAGVGGLIHSDEDLSKKYKFSDTEIAELKKDLNVKKGDAFLLIADFDTKPQHALEFAKERITLLQKGVLKEVRKANPDGTTSFMRPMPGGARMYPETDTLPITLDISKITVGKTIEETAQELLSLGVKNPDIALTLAKEYKDIFEALLKQIPNIDANVLATNIVSWASKFPELITIEKQEDIVLILKAMTAGDIAMNAGESVLEELVKDVPIKKALEKHQTLPKAEVEKIIDDVLKTLSDDDKKKFGLVMGRVMAASKGKANGKVVTDILKKKL